MNYSKYRYLKAFVLSGKARSALCILLTFLLISPSTGKAEGTRQLEPTGAPSHSYCRLLLSNTYMDNRIPFALINCDDDYRLNIRVSNYQLEKIYIGFGNITDYGITVSNLNDVKFQVKDPSGNIVPGYSLNTMPFISGSNGFIESREEAENGPNINGSNPDGYSALVLSPTMNGDYVLEFELPINLSSINRTFQFFDVTVANGNSPISGRLWSKAWQFSSGSVNSIESASFALFYIYSNDSIVTNFDCNGLSGGIWTIYSNEWGCATTGTWNDRRSSVTGNATVRPQYKIFLNDPEPATFPTGIIGEMISASVLPHVCDTVITFAATVSKAGNIEVIIDVPPFNPGAFGPEDVQLGYSVAAGYNVLLPAWDGKNAYGVSLSNGTLIEARINFLNGLTNIPLHDVEDNPQGFKVNIHRPSQGTGNSKLKIFWDDTKLPAFLNPTINAIAGCVYTGVGDVTGCHDWTNYSNSLGESNTINSWWYYKTDQALIIPITLELLPRKGRISGPDNICAGQLATFRTTEIPFAPKYVWHLTGPGVSFNADVFAPDTTFTHQFTLDMPAGQYFLSMYGYNPECGNGEMVYFDTFIYDEEPPPILSSGAACLNSIDQFHIQGTYSSTQWSVKHGEIIGSPDANPVSIKWLTYGPDTILVYSTNVDCGTRLSALPVNVYPLPDVSFSASLEGTSCPGLPVNFTDMSTVVSGSLTTRRWEWDDGSFNSGNNIHIAHSFPATGDYNVLLKVTTIHGCQSEATEKIRIIPYPVASFSCYSNCILQEVEFTDESVGLNLESWIWDFSDSPATVSDLNQQQPRALFHEAGKFPVKMIVTNRYGCKDTVTKQVQIHNLPLAASDYEFPCQGRSTIFTDQSAPTDTTLVHYTWTTKSPSGNEGYYQGNPSYIIFDEPGNYEVNHSVVDAFGCIGNNISIVDVNPRPNGSFNYFTYPGDKMGLLRFDNLTTGANDYFWDFDNGSTSTFFNPETMFDIEAEYNIILVSKSELGCLDTTFKAYYYMPGLWMPNAFTPDNDGLNDIFRPATQRTSLSPYLLLVLNRWGQVIFRSSDPDTGWDGTSDGNQCSSGSYSYIVRYREGKEGSNKTIIQKGAIILLR